MGPLDKQTVLKHNITVATEITQSEMHNCNFHLIICILQETQM
jgi:hypothetical protein